MTASAWSHVSSTSPTQAIGGTQGSCEPIDGLGNDDSGDIHGIASPRVMPLEQDQAIAMDVAVAAEIPCGLSPEACRQVHDQLL